MFSEPKGYWECNALAIWFPFINTKNISWHNIKEKSELEQKQVTIFLRDTSKGALRKWCFPLNSWPQQCIGIWTIKCAIGDLQLLWAAQAISQHVQQWVFQHLFSDISTQTKNGMFMFNVVQHVNTGRNNLYSIN